MQVRVNLFFIAHGRDFQPFWFHSPFTLLKTIELTPKLFMWVIAINRYVLEIKTEIFKTYLSVHLKQ